MGKTGKIALSILCLSGILLLTCKWGQTPYHEVRVKNNYHADFTKFRVGTAGFIGIGVGMVTHYETVEEGENDVYGECPPDGKIRGTVTFTGDGVNQWTVVVGESGYLTTIHDE